MLVENCQRILNSYLLLTGGLISPLLVKNREMSSPLIAISAISSAVGFVWNYLEKFDLDGHSSMRINIILYKTYFSLEEIRMTPCSYEA